MDVVELKGRVGNWVEIGYSYEDAVNVVFEAEKLRIRDRFFKEYNAEEVVENNESFNRKYLKLNSIVDFLLES